MKSISKRNFIHTSFKNSQTICKICRCFLQIDIENIFCRCNEAVANTPYKLVLNVEVVIYLVNKLESDDRSNEW